MQCSNDQNAVTGCYCIHHVVLRVPSDSDRDILPFRHLSRFQDCDKPTLTSRGDNLILGMSVLRCKTGILYRNGMSRTYDGPNSLDPWPLFMLHAKKTMFEVKVRIEASRLTVGSRTTENGSAAKTAWLWDTFPI